MGVATWAPTTDQILNLDGVHRRIDGFRFELCDRDLKPIGEVHPDRTGSVPSIQNDTTNNTSRRLSGFRLMPDEADDINTLTDRLRVYMVLQNGVQYRLGTFLWVDENRPIRSWGQQHDGDLTDFTYILDQEATQAFGWERGVPIGMIMYFLVMRAGFQFEVVKVLGDEALRSLTEPQAWQPGTRWLQMLNDLCNLVGFASPWFDRDGRLYFDQPPDPEVTAPTVTGYEPGTRIIADSIVPSNDMLAAPNDFAVFDSGTNRLVSGRYQLPASAPHSFAKRGFRIGLTENVQGMANQAAASKAARNLSRSKGVAFEWLTFSSTADPRHDTWDVVEALGERWLETSWSLELRAGGPMQHTMRRTTYAPT